MTALIRRLRRFVTAFRNDTSGYILPYVTLLMIVFIGFGALALDGGRYMSLQTQMQSVADALALAGARELNQRAGARARATDAINTLVDNRLSALGYAHAIAHTAPVFYSALPVATAGFTGTPATSDLDAKFVAVTVNPVTIPTIMPITFFQSAGVNNFSTGARAIAGFKARAVCDMPPVFICNPYETGGMGDAAATVALRTAMGDPTVKRKMLRMDRSQTSPGHFGYLMPPDGCNGANCLKDWIAKTHPTTCYETSGVDLNTGAMDSVDEAFNVRFDLYKGSLNYSPAYAPAVNVRKGYKGGSGGNKWCGADPSDPYYTLPIITARAGTTTNNDANITSVLNANEFVPKNPLTVTPPNGMDPVKVGDPIVNSSTISAAKPNGSAQKASASGAVSLDSKGLTSGLPLDSNLYADKTLIFGNGDWNCLDYWTINHTAAPPPGCTKTNPTISRYEVYRYEIANNLVNDWSGDHVANVSGTGTQESGAPYCAGTGNGFDPSSGNDPATGRPYMDRRIIYAAIINCTAQSALITGGSTANNIPVADFGKFFMTQPAGINNSHSDPNSLYGEMTGLVASIGEIRIMNQVQLYR